MIPEPLRVAMWSGPRNMSTTMMRSFGARADTVCVDEPFYAAYLRRTGAPHPMLDEIFAAQSANEAEIITQLTACQDRSVRIFYQKHMTHHMVAGVSRHWMASCRNVFLIRHPAHVIASYVRKMDQVTLDDIGLQQQLSLFEDAETVEGRPPLVIDSTDILHAPEAMLKNLCSALEIAWDPAMLSWPPGPKPEDGPWAPHWYDAVWRSTGFGPPPVDVPMIDASLSSFYRDALEIYEWLAAHRIRLSGGVKAQLRQL